MDDPEIAPGFSLTRARIGTVRGGEAGLLIWKSGQLVAILTEIDETAYSTRGKWFLEAGFGLLCGQHRNFDTIEEAVHWVDRNGFCENSAAAPARASGGLRFAP